MRNLLQGLHYIVQVFLLSCPFPIYVVYPAHVHRSQTEIILFVAVLHLDSNLCVTHTNAQALLACFALSFFPKLLLWSCKFTKEHHISPWFIQYLTITDTSNTLPYMPWLDDKVNPYAQTEWREEREGMTYSLIFHNDIQ